MVNQPGFKPCPFCRSTDLSIVDISDIEVLTDPGEDMVVHCNTCNAEGPWYGGSDSTTAEDAVRLWNERKRGSDE